MRETSFYFTFDEEQTVGKHFSIVQKSTEIYQLQNGGVILQGNAEII